MAVVRPLRVVADEPGVGDGAHLRQGCEEIGVQHLGAVRLIETLDVSVLGLACRAGSTPGECLGPRPTRYGQGEELRSAVYRRTAGGSFSATNSSSREMTICSSNRDFRIGLSSALARASADPNLAAFRESCRSRKGGGPNY